MGRRLWADRRVRIEAPKPRSTVESPVEIRWRSRFEPGEASGLWFIVYVDNAMTPPSQSVFTGYDCSDVATCMAEGQLEGPNVYLTDQLSVTAGSLQPGEHRATIILVDEAGIRQGDVGWHSAFRIT